MGAGYPTSGGNPPENVVAAGSDTAGGVSETRRSDDGSGALLAVKDLRLSDLGQAARLLCDVWGAETVAQRSEVITSSFLRTLVHTGNYVAGAFSGDELVGCSVGFVGLDGMPSKYLYSYISGVSQPEQNRGIGFAMKRHQREWALRNGIDTIRWTFDPLVRRNAIFNLRKLGATVRSYEPDYYGCLDDGINTGQSTDRLLVNWSLRASAVAQAMDHGVRVELGTWASAVEGVEPIATPPDIEQLRKDDPRKARAHRDRIQQRFQNLFGDGYVVAGIARDGSYVLLPPTASEQLRFFRKHFFNPDGVPGASCPE